MEDDGENTTFQLAKPRGKEGRLTTMANVETITLSAFMKSLGVKKCTFENDSVIFTIGGSKARFPKSDFTDVPDVLDEYIPKYVNGEQDKLEEIPVFGLDVDEAYHQFFKDFYRNTSRKNVSKPGFVAGFRMACLLMHNLLHATKGCPLCDLPKHAQGDIRHKEAHLEHIRPTEWTLETVLKAIMAAPDVGNTPYAKSYVQNVGQGVRKNPQVAGETLRAQLLYILSNLGSWRGAKAKSAKVFLKDLHISLKSEVPL